MLIGEANAKAPTTPAQQSQQSTQPSDPQLQKAQLIYIVCKKIGYYLGCFSTRSKSENLYLLGGEASAKDPPSQSNQRLTPFADRPCAVETPCSSLEAAFVLQLNVRVHDRAHCHIPTRATKRKRELWDLLTRAGWNTT
jgi:hypothetical protein